MIEQFGRPSLFSTGHEEPSDRWRNLGRAQRQLDLLTMSIVGVRQSRGRLNGIYRPRLLEADDGPPPVDNRPGSREDLVVAMLRETFPDWPGVAGEEGYILRDILAYELIRIQHVFEWVDVLVDNQRWSEAHRQCLHAIESMEAIKLDATYRRSQLRDLQHLAIEAREGQR